MEARSECPACQRKGLGNTHRATVQGGSRPYRQCTYCQHIHWTGPVRKTGLRPAASS